MKRFHRGLRILIIPSYACNYSCSYCSRKIGDNMPDAPRKTLGEWKRYLTDLDRTLRMNGTKIKEIIFSGGEPTILPYFTELSNWILDRWFLTFYTNLSNYKVRDIKQSTKLRIHATYHKGTNPELFCKRWKVLDKIHRVDVDEIGERRINGHKKTLLKPFATDEQLKSTLANFRVDPNHAIYIYCYSDAEANSYNTYLKVRDKEFIEKHSRQNK